MNWRPLAKDAAVATSLTLVFVLGVYILIRVVLFD
jgi:hypothetical protein